MITDWKERLSTAARNARARVIGLHLIEEAWHGILAAAAIEAFGDDPRATFFIEGMAPRAGIPRPDLIILHPDLGVLVIENKGIALDDIQSVIGSTLWVVRDGALKEEDPFKQANRVALRLRDLCRKRVGLSEVLFWDTAALPRISREEFERRFSLPWPQDAIFAETLASPETLRNHLIHCAAQSQRKTGRKSLLTQRAHDAVMSILSGKHALSTPRRQYIADTDQSLIGVQVQQLELALKEPTQQQKELGRADLSGGHWLFRGVAGSGKSVMLALNAAQTLARFVEETATLFGKVRSRRLLVVCFNKTLVHYLRQRIEERFGRIAWDKPAQSALTVIHFEGLVRRIEKNVPAVKTGLDFRRKSERAMKMIELIDALDEKTREGIFYDAVYVDEAQDLEGDELRLLLKLSRPNERGDQTLIVFYDNAQNLYGVPTPVWSKLGIRIVGRTVFLDNCLRNTRETLELAFNVLTGSFAADAQRVGTRRFADVESLRERGLIEELGGRFQIHYAKRQGPWPFVKAHPGRDAEVNWLCEAVRRLLRLHKVAPSDILILYQRPEPFDGVLETKLQKAVGRSCRVRLVDRLHNVNKNFPLLEEGVLTVSTIASAKGYDAPIVFLLGADQLEGSIHDRAAFYVGATRAKLRLIITGVKRSEPTLLDEILAAAHDLAGPAPAGPAPAAAVAQAVPGKCCRHCGSARLHAQGEGTDGVLVCIDCTRATPMELACPHCGAQAEVTRNEREFRRRCMTCGHDELYHVNVPLEELFQ